MKYRYSNKRLITKLPDNACVMKNEVFCNTQCYCTLVTFLDPKIFPNPKYGLSTCTCVTSPPPPHPPPFHIYSYRCTSEYLQLLIIIVISEDFLCVSMCLCVFHLCSSCKCASTNYSTLVTLNWQLDRDRLYEERLYETLGLLDYKA